MTATNRNESFELLKQIKSYDIEVLIHDLELLEDGYVINYVIDPFDIFNFCFPYGIKYDDKNRPLDGIGDEMIAYTYMFKNYKPIILDEYKLELFINRNNAHRKFSDHVKRNLFDELGKRLIESSQEDREVIYKELSESATFLLSSALLTKTFIERFDSIFKRLQIDSFELETRKNDDEQIILQTFRDNRRSIWSAEAFKEWVHEKDSEAYFQKRDEEGILKSKSSGEISNDLKTTYRDFVVIDRICNINRELQKNRDIKGKYLFLYFSSANKSNEIFSKESTKDYLPTIESKGNSYQKFNVLRSAKHTYLLFLFSDKNRKEIIKDLARLKEIAEKSEQEEQLKKDATTDMKPLFSSLEFESIKNRLRGEFEAEAIKSQIEKHKEYQKSLEETIIKIENTKHNLPKLKELYNDLLQKAKLVSYSINPLTRMEVDYSVQSSLSILLELLVEKKELDLHKGLDLIAGNYQHLPILLFLNNQNLINEKLRKLLFEVIGFVVKSPNLREKNLKDFFEKIQKLYSESEKLYLATDKSDREDLHYPTILIKSLIYLILPFRNNNESQESEALMFVADSFEMLKLAEKSRSAKLTDLYKLLERRNLSYKKWQYDYRYFLIWANRRNRNFKESLKIADEAIKLNPNDPRFHHGKSLALHNKYTVDNLTIVDFDCLEQLIESTETAIRLYKEINNTNQNYNKFIAGSILALQNTILYDVSLSYLYTLEKNKKNPFVSNPKFSKYSLEYLRNDLLVPIKEFEKSNKQNAQDFPELSHTESVLELCEALSYFWSGSDKSVGKITEAVRAINKAIKIDPSSILYIETRKKIEEWEQRILNT